MSKRKRIPKKIREAVYNKYKGHCAYCGCHIDYKDMQVDHIKSVYKYTDAANQMTEDEINEISNLIPSCRKCNFYKGTLDIEQFREKINTIPERLESMFLFRLAIAYDLYEETFSFTGIPDIEFYFEQCDDRWRNEC